jgi:CRISPR/Cas system Type II protein with McrA/HNH and RuvC-like nuclease domain
MRKAIKSTESKIVTAKFQYTSNNSVKNKKIAIELFKEQKGFCAYTDECITRTDARDVEHFNPKLKNTTQDSYNNWFLVKHQWNNEKLAKWGDYQPILHPTADDFEERVIYLNGDYVAKSADIEANNLIDLFPK